MPVEQPVIEHGLGASAACANAIGSRPRRWPRSTSTRLSAVDAGFLHQEGSTTHMHIGGIALLRGPARRRTSSCSSHIRPRLHLVPRYRQKLAAPPLGLGRPRWIDDPRSTSSTTCATPRCRARATSEQLLTPRRRVFSQRLDRTKPLWELLAGRGPGRRPLAIVSKTHHSLVDGVSGVDLDDDALRPRRPSRATPRRRAGAAPEPSPAQLAATSLNGTIAALAGCRWRGRARRRRRAPLDRAREASRASARSRWAALTRRPRRR